MSAGPSADQELVFYGTDGIEAEEFIRSIMKAAKAAGRLRDNSWIVDEVSVAFAGEALRWYIELDDETRNDWLRLQRAIMQRYPSPSQRTRPGNDLTVPNQPSTVPTPAASAPHPGSVPSTGASEKASYIRGVVQDTGRSFYIGLTNGNPVTVNSQSEGIMVRHDGATKALRILQKSSNNYTGEKLGFRLPQVSYWDVSTSTTYRMATLQLIGGEGLEKGSVKREEFFASWNVTDGNVLDAIPQDGSTYSIRAFLRSRDTRASYTPIRAYMDNPSDPATSSMQFIILNLEEI